eukprot:scaffold527_cov368-Prasinococcus_capsulatus_cf.AAC.44
MRGGPATPRARPRARSFQTRAPFSRPGHHPLVSGARARRPPTSAGTGRGAGRTAAAAVARGATASDTPLEGHFARTPATSPDPPHPRPFSSPGPEPAFASPVVPRAECARDETVVRAGGPTQEGSTGRSSPCWALTWPPGLKPNPQTGRALPDADHGGTAWPARAQARADPRKAASSSPGARRRRRFIAGRRRAPTNTAATGRWRRLPPHWGAAQPTTSA